MKPYYQDDAVTIYHGDCRDVLPLLPKIDLAVMDPPYGLSFNDGDLVYNWEKVFGGDVSRMEARPIISDATEREAEELLNNLAVRGVVRSREGEEGTYYYTEEERDEA